MKTSELSGSALDWAVAKCEGLLCFGFIVDVAGTFAVVNSDRQCEVFEPSTDWAQAGQIIERECIEWQWLPSLSEAHRYGARRPSLGGLNRTFCMDGPTILVAAMRCYVASKIGDEVDVPEELMEVA